MKKKRDKRILSMKQVNLFSDGACSGNPGPGGYGSTLVYKNNTKDFSKGYKLTTNNRMELLGVIEPLELLKEACEVHIVTDSQYVVHAINKDWISSWVKKGWKTAEKKPVKNVDLWKRMLEMIKKHIITIEWIRGHNGHKENEHCDQLAVAAIQGHLFEDEEYINSK